MPTHADASSRPRRAKIDARNFTATIEAAIKDLKRKHSPHMAEHMRGACRLFFDHLRSQGVRDLRAVTDAHVDAFARHMKTVRSSRGTPYAAATRLWQLQCVQRLFRFLETRGVILHNPALDVEMPRWSQLPKAALRVEQARRVMAHPDPNTPRGKRAIAILELLYGTGIRVGEAERLDVRDVHLSQGVVFIRDGKGKKDRVVPLVGRAAQAIEVYLREARPIITRKNPHQAALFVTWHGTRMGSKHMRYVVHIAGRAAEIPKPLSPHQLRHACATHLLKGGADIRHVQKLLGHASLESTAIYTRVDPQDLAEMVDRAHPRENTWRRKRSKQ